MGFAEPVIGPATSGRTRWLNPSYGLVRTTDRGDDFNNLDERWIMKCLFNKHRQGLRIRNDERKDRHTTQCNRGHGTEAAINAGPVLLEG
jgi:hypothetical protein